MTYDMGEELRFTRMEINTEVSLKTAWPTAMVYTYGATVNTTQASGNTVSRTDAAYGLGQMGNTTKVSGNLVRPMGGESM